jgi:hypothetical protein
VALVPEEVEEAPGMEAEVVTAPPRAMAASLKAAHDSAPASSVLTQLFGRRGSVDVRGRGSQSAQDSSLLAIVEGDVRETATMEEGEVSSARRGLTLRACNSLERDRVIGDIEDKSLSSIFSSSRSDNLLRIEPRLASSSAGGTERRLNDAVGAREDLKDDIVACGILSDGDAL